MAGQDAQDEGEGFEQRGDNFNEEGLSLAMVDVGDEGKNLQECAHRNPRQHGLQERAHACPLLSENEGGESGQKKVEDDDGGDCPFGEVDANAPEKSHVVVTERSLGSHSLEIDPLDGSAQGPDGS